MFYIRITYGYVFLPKSHATLIEHNVNVILSLKIRMRMDKVYFQVKMELMSHIQDKHYGWTSLCLHKAPQKVATFCLWSYHFTIARCIICLIPMSFGSHLRIIFLVFLSTFVSFHLVPSTIDRGSN